MRTSSTTNTQHPTPKHKTCSLKCALHQHQTFNTQHPNANMFPQMRTSSTPNIQQPTPKQANMFPLMRTSSLPNIQHPTPKPTFTHHHHPTFNT